MSQQDLAKKVGIPYQRIQDHERGKSKPKADRLGLIADALECSADYLLGLSNAPDQYGPEIDSETIKLARSLMQFPKETRRALIGIAQSKKNPRNHH